MFRLPLPIVCIPIMLAASHLCGDVLAATFYVSASAIVAGDGSVDAPFRTLPEAQHVVREQIALGLGEPINVEIATGTYELGEPLVFGPEDSGTAQYPVAWRGAEGADVLISGGHRNAAPIHDEDGNWGIDLSSPESPKFFRSLVVDGRRATRARWPNEDGSLHITAVSDDVTSFTLDGEIPASDLLGQRGELVVFENWSVTRGRISEAIGNHLATQTRMGWIGHGAATTASVGKTVYLESAREFLDEPGEWFFDSRTHRLTYLPLADENPETVTMTYPRLEQLIRISGTPERPVQSLQFENLKFAHTDFPLPEFGYNEIQAAHYGTTLGDPTFVSPVSIELTYARSCTFTDCEFAHLGASGIGLGIGTIGNTILRCEFDDIGANGIMIGWRGKGDLGDGNEGSLDADWKDIERAPMGNVVSDCEIRRCGADSLGGVGVYVAFSRSSRIVNNHIHEMPYTGISVGYRWNTTQTSQVDCLIAYNHIHDVMQKLADGGGIYSLGFQPGTILRGNHIHDVHRSKFAHGGAPNNGFFVDEGSQGFLFDSNVVYATSGTSVRFNNCQEEWHAWHNNFFQNEKPGSAEAERIMRKAGPRMQ